MARATRRYERAEHLGLAGSEQDCDVITWRGEKLWYFQCKRYISTRLRAERRTFALDVENAKITSAVAVAKGLG